jgi:hypothetical protein
VLRLWTLFWYFIDLSTFFSINSILVHTA